MHRQAKKWFERMRPGPTVAPLIAATASEYAAAAYAALPSFVEARGDMTIAARRAVADLVAEAGAHTSAPMPAGPYPGPGLVLPRSVERALTILRRGAGVVAPTHAHAARLPGNLWLYWQWADRACVEALEEDGGSPPTSAEVSAWQDPRATAIWCIGG